jgi:hypothetical protein
VAWTGQERQSAVSPATEGSRQVGKNKNVREAADALVGATWMANGVLEARVDLYITG